MERFWNCGESWLESEGWGHARPCLRLALAALVVMTGSTAPICTPPVSTQAPPALSTASGPRTIGFSTGSSVGERFRPQSNARCGGRVPGDIRADRHPVEVRRAGSAQVRLELDRPRGQCRGLPQALDPRHHHHHSGVGGIPVQYEPVHAPPRLRPTEHSRTRLPRATGGRSPHTSSGTSRTVGCSSPPILIPCSMRRC